MKQTGLEIAVAMLAAGVAHAGQPAATAADQRATLSTLPAVVRATVEVESKGATIKGISTEKEKGQRARDHLRLGADVACCHPRGSPQCGMGGLTGTPHS